MFKLVIFDLDGTLIDSLADLANACNKALESCGFPAHEIEKYRYFVGDGALMLIRRILPEGERSDENIARVKEKFDLFYGESYNKLTRPYDGITELLDRLAEKGVMLAVASNKPDEFTQKIIGEYFGDRFSFVSGKKEGMEKKPAPDIVYHILDKLGISAQDTLFAGDSSVDMKTAFNAGVKSIGCTWGFRTVEELKDNNAVYLADCPEDIFGTVMQ